MSDSTSWHYWLHFGVFVFHTILEGKEAFPMIHPERGEYRCNNIIIK